MSNDIEPIEIEFLINSTTVAGQAERVRQSLTGVDASVENSRKKFNELTREQLAAKNTTDGLSTAFQNLSQITAAYFTFQGAKSLLTDIINIRGEYQKTEVAFKTMLGSGEKANEIIAEMVELAAVTPFSFTEINQGAKQLLAYQVQSEDLGDTIERLGNISAGLSQPLSRLIMVYGQVKAKGKLMGDDLRQFTEAGIPIIAELAKVMKTTDSEVAKLVSNGEVGFDKVNKVIQNLTNEGGMFFNLMREQSKTIPGQIANIEDALEQMFNKMGAQSEGAINTALDGVSFLVENYESVLTVLGSLIATYGSYKVAIMTLNAIENVRNKTIATEIANLSIADKMKLGRAAVTERQAQASLKEAQAELTANQAKYASIQVEASSLALKKEKLLALGVEQAQILRNSRTQLTTAQSELASLQATGTVKQIAKAEKAVEIAQNEVIRNQEISSIANKNAIAVSQAFANNQTQLGNASRAIKIASQRVENATEVAGVATKNLSALAESRLTVAQSLRAAATQLVTRAQMLLNATMLSNPIVAIVAVLGGLIYAYMQLRDVTDANTRATERFNEEQKKSRDEAEKAKQHTQELINTIKSETSTVLEQNLAFEELKKKFPELLKNKDLYALKTAEGTYLTKEFNKEIEKDTLSNQKKGISESIVRIEQLKANLKTLQESFTKATNEHAINALNREINRTNELLTEESDKLQKSQDDYTRKIELQKLANMTVAEQKKYWEDQANVIQQQLNILRNNTSELKNSNTQVNSLLAVSVQASNVFSMWQIPTLLNQLNIAESKIKGFGGVVDKNAPKDKLFWENQKTNASADNDKMSGRAENPKAWDENIKLIREAESNLKQYDYSQKSSTKTAKTRAKDTKTALEEIAKAERDLAKMRMDDNTKEIADINDKYDKLRKQATKEKLPQNAFDRINKAEKTEIGLVTYSQDTDKLIKQLEKEKELFKLYEEAKTLIGAEEITKRYGDQLKDAKTFSERLQTEIAQITTKPEADRTGVEAERLKKLLAYQLEYEKELQELQDEKYLNAYESSLTLQERIQLIENDYLQKRKEVEKIANEELRNEKLKVLNEQKKDAINAVEDEVYEKGLKERQLLNELNNYTRKELKNRLKSTKEYLDQYAQFLSEDQKLYLETEIQLLDSIIGTTDQISKQNALLKTKERLTKDIKNNTSKDPEIAKKLNKELENVNGLLADNNKVMLSSTDYIDLAVQAANELASAFGDVNDEANYALNAFTSIVSQMVSGNIAGAIMAMAGALIKGLGDMFGGKTDKDRNREAERIRNEEEYNKMLRDRLILETRLNDEYQSRASAINEEKEALLQNKKIVLDRMKEISRELRRIFLEEIGAKDYWNKYGLESFFNNGDVQVTQEFLDKLKQVRNELGLFGKGWGGFDEIERLAEEIGGLDELIKELEKEMRDRLTGTTAQSIADSIKEGIASGKKSFADFADDIESFLRNALLAGMSTKILEPQMQKLQDLLYSMMGDGTITEAERKQFQEMYMKIVNEANSYMDMINSAGVDITGANQANSLKGAIKGITEEQADLLAGQFGGLRLAQLETNQILKSSAAYQMQVSSEMIKLQGQIEFNTRKSADVLELIYKHLGGVYTTSSTSSLTANGF